MYNLFIALQVKNIQEKAHNITIILVFDYIFFCYISCFFLHLLLPALASSVVAAAFLESHPHADKITFLVCRVPWRGITPDPSRSFT